MRPDLTSNDAIPTEPEYCAPHLLSLDAAGTLPALSLRELELATGALRDVSAQAREAGFAWPVAVTQTLWRDITTVPAAYSHEDQAGRLHDVLHMAYAAVKQARGEASELLYNLILHTEDTRQTYTVRLVAGMGDANEPVVTLSSALKDKVVALGEIVLTEGALAAFAEAKISPAPFLLRHSRGDWGALDEADWAANDRALLQGERLLAAYTLEQTGVTVWIVTEWDRSRSTILLPSEY